MTQEQMEQLELAITQCESQAEFEKLVNERSHLFEDRWGSHFREIALTKHDLSIQDIALACDVSYSKAKAFCKRVPAKRIDVILLAMRMGMTVEQTNDLLVNHAKYHRLYAKNPLDVICIYLLVVGCTREPAKVFAAYSAQYYELQKKYKEQSASLGENTNILERMVVREASGAELGDPASDKNFTNLMCRLIPQFSQSYAKLISFIDSFFSYLEEEDQKVIHNEDLLDERKGKHRTGGRGGASKLNQLNKRFSANECFGSDSAYRRQYYKAISDMQKKHTVPNRLFLVSLSVRLHMMPKDINRMLDLAGMGPLSADDRLEAAIVYVLEEVNIQNPTTFFRPQSMGWERSYEELQEFCMTDELRRLREFHRQMNQNEELDESNPIFDDIRGLERLSDQDLSKYLKWKLEDMQIFFDDSKKMRDRLIGLL